MDRDILDKIQPLIYMADRLEELASQGREVNSLTISLIECNACLQYNSLNRYEYGQKR